MPPSGKKAARTNNKKKKTKGQQVKKQMINTADRLLPLEEIMKFDLQDGKLCRDGKEVLALEWTMEATLAMAESLRKQKEQAGLHPEHCGVTREELKAAMDAKYYFDVDTLDLFLPDPDGGDEGDTQDHVNGKQAWAEMEEKIGKNTTAERPNNRWNENMIKSHVV